MKKLHIIKVLRNWFQGGLLLANSQICLTPSETCIFYHHNYLSIILLYISTYLSMSTYLHQHTYLPLTTFQHKPTYVNLPTPTKLHQHTYLPISTHLSTYFNTPTYLCLLINTYKSMWTYIPVPIPKYQCLVCFKPWLLSAIRILFTLSKLWYLKRNDSINQNDLLF